MSQELRICPHVPVLFVSAVTGKGLRDVLPTSQAIRAECHIRVGTGELNRLLREALERHQPPLVKGKRPKFYYLTQTDTVPATFVFFVNDPERIKASYAKFLENQLRKLFGVRHAPVKLIFRGSRQRAEDGTIVVRARPKPQKPGSEKTYPSQSHPAKPGSTKPGSSKPSPAKSRPTKPIREKSDPSKPSPEKSDTSKPSRDRSDSSKPSRSKSDSSKSGSRKPRPARSGPSKSGPARSRPGKSKRKG